MKDKFKKTKKDSYSDLVKTTHSFSSYDPKTFGNKTETESVSFFSMEKFSVLDKITTCRDSIRNGYKNNPSYAEIEKVLTHALAEITNLEKKIERLQKQLDQSNEDIIQIKVGDETVIIDGDLASQVISSGVTNYITEALQHYSK